MEKEEIMDTYEKQGDEIRTLSKSLVIQFMISHSDCTPTGQGLRQAEIFRRCGFSYGDQDKADPPRQQYWVVALLRDLESEGMVEQVRESGPWRLASRG